MADVRSLIAGYNGHSLSPKSSRLIRELNEIFNIVPKVTGPGKKTIRLITRSGIDIGYINSTTLKDFDGAMGYKFQGDKPNDACPKNEATSLADNFIRKYQLSINDITIQKGIGSNAGRHFLIIKTVDAALSIIRSDFTENDY